MSNMSTTPSNKESWKIETTGIDIVPESERIDKPIELFWIWSAANIGILGVVYGAILISFNLSFLQAILAAIAGIASFSLVGYISFAGKLGRTSTLTLSRAIFGIRGNIAPTAFSWINLMGWEIVNIITGTLTLISLMQAIGFSNTLFLKISCLAAFSGLAFIVCMLGQNTVIIMQNWFTKIFGSLTLIIVLYVLFSTNWHAVFSLPPGSWLTGFLPAVSIIAAGTGISWAIAGVDYSRYQSDKSRNRSIFTAVTTGAGIPLFLLILTGILLSVQLPSLADSSNPIELIATTLPRWLSIPYLTAATAGIVTISVLSLYSASLNLLTLGIKVKQIYAVSIDALVVLSIAIYVLFISGEFLNPFISFLVLCGVFLAAWEAVFIVDYFMIRKHIGYKFNDLYSSDSHPNKTKIKLIPFLCWLAGSISGLMVTNVGFMVGPFAVGVFANSNLGLFIAFLISFILYLIYLMICRKTII